MSQNLKETCNKYIENVAKFKYLKKKQQKKSGLRANSIREIFAITGLRMFYLPI